MKPIERFERNGAHKHLFVVLHAYGSEPERLKSIRHAIKSAHADADIYTPRMPFAGKSGLYCTRDAADVVCDLLAAIDQIVEERRSFDPPEYETVNFVGHSVGAVLARRVAIVA